MMMTSSLEGGSSGWSGSYRSMVTGISTSVASGSSSSFFLICPSISFFTSPGVEGSGVSPTETIRSFGLMGSGVLLSGSSGLSGSGFSAVSSGPPGTVLPTSTPGLRSGLSGSSGFTRPPPMMSSMVGGLGASGSVGSAEVGSASSQASSVLLPVPGMRVSQGYFSSWSGSIP